MGGLEILILIGILLARAQKGSVKDLASAAAAKANEALQAASDAHARGDHNTAAEKRAEADQHAATAQKAAKAARTPPPWPQSIPAGLPAFPSAGWRPASPVTSAMVSRGWQLLPQLWAAGEGTWKPEKTGDRWVVYQAAQMGEKRGVVAFTTSSVPRSASAQRSPQVPGAPSPAAPAPATVEVPEVDAMGNPTGATTALAAFHPAAAHPAAAPAAHSMPTLRLMTPRTRGPSVVWLQQKLGIPNPDGVFGPGTQSSVINFQHSHGLTADGVVGPATWHALGVGSPSGTMAA